MITLNEKKGKAAILKDREGDTQNWCKECFVVKD